MKINNSKHVRGKLIFWPILVHGANC